MEIVALTEERYADWDRFCLESQRCLDEAHDKRRHSETSRAPAAAGHLHTSQWRLERWSRGASPGGANGDPSHGGRSREGDLRLRGAVLDRVGFWAVPAYFLTHRVRGHQRYVRDEGTGDGYV